MTTSFQPSLENQLSEYIYDMGIPGLYYVKHKKFADNRGFYAELNRIPELEQLTKTSFNIQQMNLSYSEANVIRGFHAEDWNKLLSIIDGTIFGAWVDIRPDSNTFGNVVTALVGLDESALFGSVYVSNGIANSFCVTHGPVNYLYAVDALYAERDVSKDVALSLFDPDLAINWPISREHCLVSQRDLDSKTMRELFPQKYAV
jgi:dTDP-4-dehydrorhamnose 3,5-epimerase